MCSFGGFMGTGLCLTNSLATSELERNSRTERMADYDYIRLEVERRTSLPGGNTRRRFHGTIRACTLGDTAADGNLCAQTTCNMCRIIEVPLNVCLAPRDIYSPLFCRAPSNAPAPVSAQTLADLEKAFIHLRPHLRSVCVADLSG
jgi:hypothetical protein